MLTLIIINGFPQYSDYQLLGYLQPGEKPGARYVQEWRSWEIAGGQGTVRIAGRETGRI
jgi:hypothetical protein